MTEPVAGDIWRYPYLWVWVILDEHNLDTLEKSLYFEPGAKVGTFSKAQTKLIAARFLAAYRARGGVGGVDRTE